ncbi:hypothetical protein FQN50_004115 [Emmonsiellopsis sp. PD_5]|nr:hypothetical protein FQN50_004115 [Emmonsiellopsis sp. PD_5]
MEALSAAASVITIVEVSAKAAASCLKYINRVKASNVERKLLQDGVKSLLDTLNHVARLLDGPNSSKLFATKELHQAVHDCLSELEELEKRLRPKTHRKITLIAHLGNLKWPFEGNEAERRLARIKECRETLSLALNIDQTTTILDVQHSTALATILSQLPSADGASFDSHANEHDPRCHPETRTDLLQQILVWARDPQSEAIFWLNGMAGTGKSTVSRTIARTLSQDSTLGASFFFKRGEGDRGHAARFFATIATQLVAKLPPLLESIKKVVDTDPGVSKKTLTEQFEKLILEPLISLEGDTDKAIPLVIVIDALDECETAEDVKTILYNLARTKKIKSVNLRIFATSRPELPIRLGFKEMPGDSHRDLVLHELPAATIKHDISAYLKHELSKIKDEHNKSLDSPNSFLPVDWPGQPNLDILVEMAVPLFIFAATVCRFIGESRFNPQKRLEDVLKYQSVGDASKFDRTYLPVLDQLLFELDEPDSATILAEFKEVVACPTDAESPIRLLHLSFRDYLIDPTKRGSRFFLNEVKQHGRIALKCLEILSKSGILKMDICGVKEHGTLRTEIPSQKIEACLPPEVQYACCHWVHHLEKSDIHIRDGDEIDTFLRKYLLHWFEALSLCGKISQSIAMITTLQGLVIDSTSKGVAGFLYDTGRFVIRNRWIMDTSPLQVYSSALAFSPVNSILKKQFQSFIPPWIRHLSGLYDDWGPALQTLDPKGLNVRKIVFSNTSNLLALLTTRTVTIWDSGTGELRQELEDSSTEEYYDITFANHHDHLAVIHHDSVQVIDAASGVILQVLLEDGEKYYHHVRFSPNDKLLAAKSSHHVRIWDSATCELRLTIEGPFWETATPDSCIAFSPDSNYVASAVGMAVDVWDLCEKQLLRSFRTDELESVMVLRFTDNGTLVSASGRTIRIWDVATGNELHVFKSNMSIEVTFSGNGKLMACHNPSARELSIREPSSGKLLRTLVDNSARIVTIFFSEDPNKLIVTGSKGIHIWDINTGRIMHTIETFGESFSFFSHALSRDSKLLAHATPSGTVKLWDLDSVIPNQRTENLSSLGARVALSPDAKFFAVSDLTTVRIYDRSHTLITQLEESSVYYMTFSENSESLIMRSGSAKVALLTFNLITHEEITLLDLSHLTPPRWTRVLPMDFTSDWQILAIAVEDNIIHVLNLRTGEAPGLEMGTPINHQFPGNRRLASLKFAPDGKLIAACHYLESQSSCLHLLRHSAVGDFSAEGLHITFINRIDAVEFSPDSKQLIVYNEHAVGLWDLTTGKEVQRIENGSTFWEAGISNDDCSFVETKYGILRYPSSSAIKKPAAEPQSPFKLFYRDDWILRDGKRLLWIPPEYRPNTSRLIDFHKNTFLMAHPTGKIITIELACD